MALPKRRVSKARRDNRRAHWKISPPALTACPQCHQLKMPHRVCPHCGFYKGRKVLEVEGSAE